MDNRIFFSAESPASGTLTEPPSYYKDTRNIERFSYLIDQ